MEMKSPARGDLTMPERRGGVRARLPQAALEPPQGPTLLEDIAIVYWDGCSMGGPTVQHQACGTSICKAAMGWVKETVADSERV